MIDTDDIEIETVGELPDPDTAQLEPEGLKPGWETVNRVAGDTPEEAVEAQRTWVRQLAGCGYEAEVEHKETLKEPDESLIEEGIHLVTLRVTGEYDDPIR